MSRLILIICCLFTLPLQADEPLSYTKDIRPILSDNCFGCHGPDTETREADLRLDTFAGATQDLGGHSAIKPKSPEDSELIARVTSDDEFEVMPPSDSGKSLTPEQIQTLRRWISQGAEYEKHWSFTPPKCPEVPQTRNPNWCRNPIDNFVVAALPESVQPNSEADKYALVRRVYLDLIGLPPTIEQADAFAADTSVDAYDNLVDQLLKSPQYGERWTRPWLDLARYADTNGYEKDRPRSIWPYRDWVINALNDDMPFDQFTIEQLAGDMLPDATMDQKIATGFHRNTMLNEEGGIDPLEYRFYAMVDRVATTGTVWLGMTVGCAQCHTHKYDPLTHTDYYRMMALLNNADEPDLIVPSENLLKRQAEIDHKIEAIKASLANSFPAIEGEGPIAERRQENLETKFTEWLAGQRKQSHDWQAIAPSEMKTNLPRLEILEDKSILSTGDITKRDVFDLTFELRQEILPIKAIRLEVLPDDRLPARGPGRAFYEGRKGDFFLSELSAELDGNAVSFTEPSNSFGKISIGNGSADARNVLDGDGSTGWSTATREGEPHQLVLNFEQPIEQAGSLHIKMLFERHFAASLGRFRFSVTHADQNVTASQLPVDIEDLCAKSAETLTDEERQRLKDFYLTVTPELAELHKQIAALEKQRPEFPTTMVMEERHPDNPRETHVHHRGEYLNTKDAVSPGIPEMFVDTDRDKSELPSDRLEFAQWLVSEDNPLAARVAVNRAWRKFFGYGLVRTPEDFGTQSEYPTHPQLLDWLACQFMSQDGMKWSMKKLHRLIVTSATYRQSSFQSDISDPQNRHLARGPRHRLDAEVIRDMALHASGLLSLKIGGPSVYPPQPASVTGLAYGNTNWNVSKGEDRYRRSLYTFSKRTAPFAAYTVFDGPTGEECTVKRDRSNTPLQALTLLNDEMYLEAARALASKCVSTDKEPTEIATEMFRRLLTRPPTDEELTQIVAFYQQQFERFEKGTLSAKDVTQTEAHDKNLAAWTLVARVLLNLDETISKN